MHAYRDPINRHNRCDSVYCREHDDPHVVQMRLCPPIQDGCRCVDTVTLLEPERCDLSSLVPNIIYEAQGVPANVAADYAREAIIDVAREMAGGESAMRRRWVIDTQECVTDYYLHNHETEVVERIKQVWIDGQKIDVISHNAVMTRSTDICSGQTLCGGRATYYRFEYPNQITIHDRRDQNQCPASMIEVLGSVVPDEGACEFDCEFINRFARAIRHGALAKLFRIPERKWTSNGLSTKHEDLYRKAIEIGLERDRSNMHGHRSQSLIYMPL